MQAFTIWFLLTTVFFIPNENLKIDFSKDDNWYIVNDGVMGGLSKGNESIENGRLGFSGNLSLENNGGFSWAKSNGLNWDLSDYEKVVIKYKTDDHGYDFTFETPEANNVAMFQKRLSPTGGKWKTEELSLDEFALTYFGQDMGKNFAAENRTEVLNIGILIADKKPGNFEMQVDEIYFK